MIVFKSLISQYDKIKKEGVTYSLNGETIIEQHFDFKNTIIKELQAYEDWRAVPTPNWDAIDVQWRKGVGAQKLLPMHVCRNPLC